jgi:hypothetical protein
MDTIGGHHVKWSKVHVFSLMWKIGTKINICTKTGMIMYKLRWRTCLLQWNYSMELGERGKGNENDRALVILHIIRCEGWGYKDVYWKQLKN